MFRGRVTIGQSVQLALWARDVNGLPTLPDVAPTANVYAGNVKLKTFKMPIQDRFQVVGFFSFPLFLGKGLYHTGSIRVRYQYAISGSSFVAEDLFDIVDGGDDDGTGISCFYFRRPLNSFVIIQGEGGRLLRRRNPALP